MPTYLQGSPLGPKGLNRFFRSLTLLFVGIFLDEVSREDLETAPIRTIRCSRNSPPLTSPGFAPQFGPLAGCWRPG